MKAGLFRAPYMAMPDMRVFRDLLNSLADDAGNYRNSFA
jgi:hypothetical protein